MVIDNDSLLVEVVVVLVVDVVVVVAVIVATVSEKYEQSYSVVFFKNVDDINI